MPLDNHTVELELVEQAKAILCQYDLGNKSTARAMFNQIPAKRQPLVAGYMFVHAGNNNVNRIITFLRSVAE